MSANAISDHVQRVDATDNESKPLVSIIVPVFNAADYIDACILSIVNQTYGNIEIVIENDGSTDESLEKCNSWKEKDSRILVFNHENWGVSKSRNHAMKNCGGEYVAFVDADDIIYAKFIDTLVNRMESTNADCVVVGIVKGAKFNDNLFSKGNFTLCEGQNIAKQLFTDYGGFLCNKLYRNNIIKEFHVLLCEEISVTEDLLFNAIYFQHCKKVVYYSGKQYFYRQHGESAVNRLDNAKWFDCLQVYPLLWDMYQGSMEMLNILSFPYAMTLLEARARLHYVKNGSTTENRQSLRKKIRTLSSVRYNWSMNQKIKYIAFYLFPKTILKYRRRMLRGK